MLRARLATAAIAIPLLLLLILWGPPWGLAVLVGVLALLGLVEYANLAFAAQPRDRLLTLGLGTLVILAASVSTAPGPLLLAALVAFVIGGAAWLLFGRRDFDRGLRDLGLALLGVFFVGVLFPHFVWLRHLEQGPQWVTLVIAMGMGGDTGGYFVGRAFGRHRLMPRISPGKTVEGAVGIVLASILVGGVAKLVLLPTLSGAEVLSLAVIMALLGQLGDLTESVVKRAFGSKESGWLFPGHGGVLDRIDSLLFPVSFLYYYRVLVQ